MAIGAERSVALGDVVVLTRLGVMPASVLLGSLARVSAVNNGLYRLDFSEPSGADHRENVSRESPWEPGPFQDTSGWWVTGEVLRLAFRKVPRSGRTLGHDPWPGV